MGSPYEIDITMSRDTVAQLKGDGFALYAFKAVKTSITGGAPLVWFSTTTLLTSTTVDWQEDYQAYISKNAVVANGQVTASTQCDITLGQTANVDINGNMAPSSAGSPGSVSIMNNSKTRWTTGISQLTDGEASPMCAIPLPVGALDQIVPIEKVLLMFATNSITTGTVVYQSYSAGLLVDLTASQTRSVTYDSNNLWSAGGGTWALPVPPQSNLVPILITT